MFSTPVADALRAFRDAVQALGALDGDALPVAELLGVVEEVETGGRRVRALACDLAAAVERRGSEELCGPAYRAIADVARLSPAEARRRLRDAAQLSPRTTLTGQCLPPQLPATAKAWAAGGLDVEHLRVIQRFLRELPVDTHPGETARAEVFLAEKAAELRPDQLQVVADRLSITINPDGRFTDEDRARRRGFTWCGRQRPDGMTEGRLTATPELRATIDALLAKFAAPGRCNPADQTPTVNGDPTQDVIDRDLRSVAQRQHDALGALLRSQLGSPAVGQHNGLPVTVIATATVEQLSSATGHAVTGGGSLLPMRDLIRMASHAFHYLCIYEKHTRRPLYLGRTKRIASADQRIVLHALERGCTRPGCSVPGYLTEVHHTKEWADGGLTDVTELTLGCKPDHRLIKPGGWRTRKRSDGVTEWIPPPHLPLRGGTNDYHHPERLLPGDEVT